MKAQVLIRFKEDVPDSQGDLVGKKLVELGYQEVTQVRMGKLVEFQLEAADRDAMKERLARMCRDLLAHPLIEDFEVLSVE